MENDTELNLSNISYTISGDFNKSGTLNDSVLLKNNVNAGTTKTITIDISGLNEEGYLSLMGYCNSGSIQVNKIWLEK